LIVFALAGDSTITRCFPVPLAEALAAGTFAAGTLAEVFAIETYIRAAALLLRCHGHLSGPIGVRVGVLDD